MFNTSDCGCGGDAITGGGDATTGGSYKQSAAAFGRVYSVIGAVIGGIIAIICVFLGFSKLRDKRTQAVEATVTRVNTCSPISDTTPQGGGVCVVDVNYDVGGRLYTAAGLSVSTAGPLRKGSTVTLQYDPNDPRDAVYESPPRWVGMTLVGLGLLVGGVTSAIAVMTFKSEAFAAGYGTIEGVGMLSSII